MRNIKVYGANIATAAQNRIAHLHNALVHARLHKTRAHTLFKKKSYSLSNSTRAFCSFHERVYQNCAQAYMCEYIRRENGTPHREFNHAAAAQVEGYFTDQRRAQSTKP